jgi:uridine kinase
MSGSQGPVIIGVTGCSGSGKTSLAQELGRELEGTFTSILQMKSAISAVSHVMFRTVGALRICH